jgi:hypothetical protein
MSSDTTAYEPDVNGIGDMYRDRGRHVASAPRTSEHHYQHPNHPSEPGDDEPAEPLKARDAEAGCSVWPTASAIWSTVLSVRPSAVSWSFEIPAICKTLFGLSDESCYLASCIHCGRSRTRRLVVAILVIVGDQPGPEHTAVRSVKGVDLRLDLF